MQCGVVCVNGIGITRMRLWFADNLDTQLQMFFPSLMHTLENIPHLVPTSLISTVMGMSLDSLAVDTPPQPHVVHHMLLEFAAKGNLLQTHHLAIIVTFV